MLQSSVEVRRRTECGKTLTVASNCSCVKDISSISLMTEDCSPCKGARDCFWERLPHERCSSLRTCVNCRLCYLLGCSQPKNNFVLLDWSPSGLKFSFSNKHSCCVHRGVTLAIIVLILIDPTLFCCLACSIFHFR